jgi:selenocysteine lyase/cysteine desulfurase
MLDRRSLLQRGATLVAGAWVHDRWPDAAGRDDALRRGRDGVAPSALATDEAYWGLVAQQFAVDGRYIVLNGGGQNPPTRATVEALVRGEAHAAAQPRPNNLQLLAQVESHRRRLAGLLNADPAEVALTRNTTEGLNVVIHGVSMRAGDEVVVSPFERHYAEPALATRVSRDGVRVIRTQVALPPSDDAIVEAIGAAITPRTRLVICSHIADGWGFVLPIARIAAELRPRGIPLLCDGAWSFAHIPVDVRALGCDYYATSLHKWLGAPLGTGLLHMRHARIAETWPLYGSTIAATDIRKFEAIGTRAGAPVAAIGAALDFHEAIGPAHKAARLRALLHRLLSGVADVSVITPYTDADPERRGSLARLAVAGWRGEALATALRERHGIYTFGGFDDTPDGIYVAPNLFNTFTQIDRTVVALRELAATRGGGGGGSNG